ANAERLATGADLVREALSEGERTSAVDRLGEAAVQLAELARIDDSLAEDQQALDLLIEQVGDLARRVRQYREQIEFNPARLEEIEERLNLIHDLERKYGSAIADVLRFADEARAELDQIEHREERIADLEAREQALLDQLAERASLLSKRRHTAARHLAEAVENELSELNMAGARFDVVFQQALDPAGVPLADGRVVVFDATGIDRVEFFIAPNAGEDFKPLVRVVSGGETARLMLALKN